MTSYNCAKCNIWIGTEYEGNKNWLKHKCLKKDLLKYQLARIKYIRKSEKEGLCYFP